MRNIATVLSLGPLAVALALFLTACAASTSTILVRQDSALYPAVTKPWPGSRERRVRSAIVEQLPLGSSRAEIEQFVDRNFIGVIFLITTSDDKRALSHPKEPHLLIRALDRRSDRVEIYLVLTPEQRLKNVVVRAFAF